MNMNMNMENINNNNNSSQFSLLVNYSLPMMTIAGVITLITMVVGVCGNILTVGALVKHSKIRTVAAAFIGSLCISDLLFCFLVLPFSASQFFNGKWIHGDVLCTIIPLLRYSSVGISLLSIATISINRYILIASPSVYITLFNRKKVIIYIAFIWCFSYGLMIPILAGVWGKFGLDSNLGTCSIIKDENGNSPKTALFILAFVLPCIVIVVSYSRIYWIVRKSSERVQQHRQQNSGTKRSEMNITKMVLAIFFCFVICYLPLTLVKVFDGKVKSPPVHVVAYLLLYLSSCINPVIYVTMNKQYRRAYFNTLTCNFTNNIDSSTPMHNSKSMAVMYAKNVIQSPHSKGSIA